VLEIIDHKKTTKREKLNGYLEANHSRETAVLRSYKMANYFLKTADLERFKIANHSRNTAVLGRFKMANYSWKTTDLRRFKMALSKINQVYLIYLYVNLLLNI